MKRKLKLSLAEIARRLYRENWADADEFAEALDQLGLVPADSMAELERLIALEERR